MTSPQIHREEKFKFGTGNLSDRGCKAYIKDGCEAGLDCPYDKCLHEDVDARDRSNARHAKALLHSGLSHREVATALDCSLRTVSRLLAKGTE